MKQQEANILTLRGLIISKFKSYKNFADEINWSRQKLSYKLANPDSITVNEAGIMAKALGIQLSEETIQIFLPYK